MLGTRGLVVAWTEETEGKEFLVWVTLSGVTSPRGGGPAGSLRYAISWQTSGLQGFPAPQDVVDCSHRGIKVVTS